MNEFERKVGEFFFELGVSGKKTSSFLDSGLKDYRKFLIEKGARRLGYLKDLRKVAGHRGIVLTDGKLVITTTNPEQNLVALMQEDESGKTIYPSEGVIEWLYHGKTTIEPPILAAYHKLFEIVGKNSDIALEYFGEKTSTIVQENRDIVYEVSFYYRAHVPYDVFTEIEKRKNWKVVALPEGAPY